MYRRSQTSIFSLFLILTCNVVFIIKLWSDTQRLQETVMIDTDVFKFNNYLIQFNKTYSGLEYKRRLQNFKVSLAEITRLNTLEGYTVFGLTQFSDMSDQEFAGKMLMKDFRKDRCKAKVKPVFCNENIQLSLSTGGHWANKPIPSKFDWRIAGFVSPVADQLMCLGCWAFSVVGVMETMAAKRNISRETLSVQELLDCSEYNRGCSGGNVHLALEYICDFKLGIISEKMYRLNLRNQDCHMRFIPNETKAVTVKSYRYYCDMKEDDILNLIVNHGPVTSIVDARHWRFYLGGIIRRACFRDKNSSAPGDHAVQIVGYDKTGAVPYYIVKNSWGRFFGDHGYVKVAMYGNICGIADEIGVIDVKEMKTKYNYNW